MKFVYMLLGGLIVTAVAVIIDLLDDWFLYSFLPWVNRLRETRKNKKSKNIKK